MNWFEVRNIEPGSAIDCPPCDPDDPRQRFAPISCFRTVVDISSISWQLDGHGGEKGTIKEQKE